MFCVIQIRPDVIIPLERGEAKRKWYPKLMEHFGGPSGGTSGVKVSHHSPLTPI